MKAGKIKKLSTKSLSVLLAVVMIMSSMNVCFGTITFAAGGSVSNSTWNEFIGLLKNDTVKNANFTSTAANNYTVTDPDGKIIAAVEKYFDIFNTLADKAPANSSAGNRTINQVNSTIKSTLSSKMSGDYSTYNIDNFITKLMSGANVSSSKGTKKENETGTAPGTNLSAVSDVKLNVALGGELTKYASIDELPDEIATTKTFTVKHANTNYDKTERSENTSDSCGNVTGSKTIYGFEYYYSISSVTEAEGAKQSTKVLKDTAKTLTDNSAYLNANLDQMVQFAIYDAAALAAAKTAINNAKSNATNFSSVAWNQYFSADYDAKISTFNSNFPLASEIVSLGEVAYPLTGLKEAGYMGMDETQLRALYSQLTEGLETFDSASAAVRDYIANHKYNGVEFVRADIQTFADEVLTEIRLVELRRLKADIDNTIPAYYDYNEDDVINGTLSGATVSVAKGKVDGFIQSINSYPANLVNIVMHGYSDTLSDLSSDLAYLIKIANYDDQFSAEYAKFVAEVYMATDITADSATLVAALKGSDEVESYDAWYSGLKTLIGKIENELEADAAEKILAELDDEMKDHMESTYETLHSRVDAQLDIAKKLYDTIVALDGKIDILTVTTYSRYKYAFENLDRDTYNYLKDEAANFTMPQATIDKYNYLKDDFTKYNEFIATGGFSSFKQILGEYANRELLPGDILRDEEYVVDKAKVEKVIAGLDKLITSKQVGDLLGGLLGAAEGEAFNLGTMLTDTVKEMLFTDDFINTVVGALYPVIAEGLVGVWHKDIPNMVGDFDIIGMLQKNLYQIADGVGLALFPATVAKTLDSTKYADNITKLNAADTEFRAAYPDNADDRYVQETIKAEDGTVSEVKVIATPWKSSALYDETGTKMTLTWGVDAARKQYEDGEITQAQFETVFYEAFDDAFDGIRALFRALIGETKFEGNTVNVLSMGSGFFSAGANLSLDAQGNAGYANLLVPIYEALGAKVEGTKGATFTYEAPATIKGYAAESNSTALLLEAILAPIFSFLGEIGNAPLATLIEALPNLCYALSMQMVSPLLGMLKTSLEINIELTGMASLLGSCDELPIDLSKPIPYDLAVGGPDGLLKLEDHVDLSGGINSLLSMLGLPLPEIDQGKLAQMGEKVTIPTSRTEYIYTGLEGTGTAYHIAADKGAVGNYLLQYIFGILENEEAFKGLLGMLVTKDVPVLDENGEPTYDEEGNAVVNKVADEEKIEATIASIEEMGLFKYGKNNAIAAIVELFNQEENLDFSEYVWYEDECFDGTVQGLTPAMIQYLSYDNDLTREKAAYIVDHLDELAGSVMDMINGDPEGTASISAMLNGLIGGLFTNENITFIAKKLAELDINALIAGSGESAEAEAEPDAAGMNIDVNTLINDLLGINLASFKQYAEYADDYDWGVTDAASFASTLANLLAPLNPLLNFILKGDDIQIIKDANGAAITLKGYNGYDTAIVPLLEALGCETKAIADEDNAIEVILLAIVNKLETITGEGADAVEGILNLLPGVLYFLQSNALASVVDNLLHPVYQLLDTIRPIYDLNLDELLGTLLATLPIQLDLNNLDLNFVLNLVKDLVGLDLTALGVVIADICKIAVEDYKSSSSIIGENGKKGAYTELFNATDLIAVILNFAFDWCTDEANVDALAAFVGGEDAEMVETVKTYINGIFDFIAGIEPTYETIDWAYNFPEGFPEAIFSSGISIKPTIESLNYPTDWTEDTAKYLDENLNELITAALKMAGVEGTLSDMLKSKINIFTGANLNALVTMLTDLLGKLNKEIVDNAGVLIGADLEALRNYKADEEKTYTTVEFAKELGKILNVIPEVVGLVFFADNFEIFNHGDGKTVVTITGAHGYAEGLAPILEALGCKNLPEIYGVEEFDSKAAVEAILVSIANRFDEILADPVNEIFDVLPNIIYFLNANGISTSVKNMLASVTGLTAKLKETLGVELDLIAIINNALNDLLPEDSKVTIDANNLDLETIFALVQELLGLDLTAASNILVDFCVGKIEAFDSTSVNYGFRMVYDEAYARYDMITILATVALMLVENENNAAVLDEMIGTEIMAGLKEVFSSAPVIYATPDWDYCWAEDGIDYTNGTVDVMKYAITYPNNWTEESAKYVAENLGAIGDMIAGVIDSNYTTLGALVNDKIKIYSGENIEAIANTVAGLLGEIDETLITAAGKLLGADIAGLKSYKAPEGIDTAKEFANELANVLTTYAGGLLDWLLFGEDYRFFVDETIVGEKFEDGEEIITINGGLGYANGLALILEALGVEGLPAAESKDVKGILTATFARLDEILANPAVEVFNLLPNLLYFLNANGVAIAFDNLLAAVTTLLNKLSALGVELDIAELINIEELLGIEEDLKISIDNLTIEAILELVAYLTEFDFDLLKEVLVGFALGEVKEYASVSRTGVTYKMYYNDEFAVYDMITVLANLVVLTAKDEDNAEKLEELLGEEVYSVILNVFNMGKVPVQKFDWKLTDKADTDYVFSAIVTSELYVDHQYGPLYTKEMEKYIADNFGKFVNNIIYLLGLNINGNTVDNLTDLINGLVNGSVYNSANVVAIRDALAGVLDGIANLEANGANVGKHIAAVLKTAEIADIEAVAKVNVPEFTEDRAKFVESLCDVLEPLYNLLKWVLANEDISFFVNLDKTDAITLPGAEGYAYGIIPLLEVLECENILTPAEYYAAVESDGDVLLTSILNPLLDRVDVIIENPAEEILAILPNLIYFINSNGIDTVVKNTLNAVYTLLNAIEPIAKIDLYELIGLDLATLDFNKILDMLLDMIYEATGYKFTFMDISAIAELSVGTLVSYESKNGEQAYKMVYQSTTARAEMVTVVMRLLVTFIMHENNQEMLLGLLKDNLGMTADAEKYVRGILDYLRKNSTVTALGMDLALATLYYIFYGLDIGVDHTANGIKDLNAEWTKRLNDMKNSNNDGEALAGEIIADILDLEIFDDIVDPEEGVAPNGFIAFFQKIADWFNKIIEWLKNLFN